MSLLNVILLILFVAIVIYALMRFTPIGRVGTMAAAGISKIFTGGRGVYRIFTQEPWITEIAAGRKKVEARVGPPDFYKGLIGQKIKLVAFGGEKNDKKKVIAEVTAVRHYKDLAEYLKAETWQKVAPHVKSEQEAVKAYLEIKDKSGNEVYGAERVKEKGGITAIEFKVLK